MRIVRMSGVLFSIFAAATCTVNSSVPKERLGIEWNVPITVPAGGVLQWAEMKVDPEDSNHLIVCGTEWRAEDNSFYGVVYVSGNSGKDWRVATQDHAAGWVTEHSCAFGRHHKAYFVSEEAKIVNDELHHDEGTTHIFLSIDSGETWSKVGDTGWADFSISAVAPVPDRSEAQQLYVFYNGDSKYSSAEKLGSTLDFFTVSENGSNLSPRQTVAGMAEKNYQGVYPSSSAVLNDGTVIILYNANRVSIPEARMQNFDIGVVRFTSRGTSLPTIIASPAFKNNGEPACPVSLSNTLAYDSTHNVLYMAYNDASSGHCALMLARSDDQGMTWSKPIEFSRGDKSGSSMYFPILAVNGDGLIGLLWRGRPQYSPDCWYFSTFRYGASSEDTITLDRCLNVDSLSTHSSAYLMTHIRQAKPKQPAFVDLLTTRDYLTRIGMITTPDGAFHPVWPSLGAGFGELRTASVYVGPRPQLFEAHPLDGQKLTEATDKVAVLYGGGQYFDHVTNSIVIKLSFRNKSALPLQGPLYLQVEDAESEFGEIELVKPSQGAPNKYLDVSSSLRGGSLAPGEVTSPYSLTFHLIKESNAQHSRYSLAKLKLRLFCPCKP